MTLVTMMWDKMENTEERGPEEERWVRVVAASNYI